MSAALHVIRLFSKGQKGENMEDYNWEYLGH